jgi:transcriptional regulator with XRE-family HTH domain
MRLGKRARAHRLRLGMTQEEVGRAIGVKGHVYVSFLEHGTANLSTLVLVRLAKVLRTTVAELLEGSVPHVWKATPTDCRTIYRAAAKEARRSPTTVRLEPAIRYNTRYDDGQQNMNIALVSRDPLSWWEDTGLADFASWAHFRKGVELTPDGRAIVEFYVYDRKHLIASVTAYRAHGRLQRLEGGGGRPL